MPSINAVTITMWIDRKKRTWKQKREKKGTTTMKYPIHFLNRLLIGEGFLFSVSFQMNTHNSVIALTFQLLSILCEHVFVLNVAEMTILWLWNCVLCTIWPCNECKSSINCCLRMQQLLLDGCKSVIWWKFEKIIWENFEISMHQKFPKLHGYTRAMQRMME